MNIQSKGNINRFRNTCTIDRPLNDGANSKYIRPNLTNNNLNTNDKDLDIMATLGTVAGNQGQASKTYGDL